MKRVILGVCAAVVLVPAAGAAEPKGQVTGYLTQAEVDPIDGSGFGVRGWFTVSPGVFLHGELATADLDGVDLQEFRAGGGVFGALDGGMMWIAKGEFLNLGGDYDQSGFGAHGGLIFGGNGPFTVLGTIGYLSTDDTSGMEFNIGGQYAFNAQWGGSLDYRTYGGSVDGGGDFDANELRIGVTYSF